MGIVKKWHQATVEKLVQARPPQVYRWRVSRYFSFVFQHRRHLALLGITICFLRQLAWLLHGITKNNALSLKVNSSSNLSSFQKKSPFSQNAKEEDWFKNDMFSNSSSFAVPFDVTDRKLCFIHVGKTGGSSFRAQFANGLKKNKNLKSMPALKVWREYHTGRYGITATAVNNCDYFVAWVRDPIDRAVSAYNMVFDQEWHQEVAAVSKTMHKALVQQTDLLGSYGSLNDLAEKILVDPQAQAAWGSIEHVKFNMAWFFTSHGNGKPLSQPLDVSANAGSWLLDRKFLSKLVFVGAAECYQQDIERFALLFGIPDSFMANNPIRHTRRRARDSFDAKNLTHVALKNLQNYFKADYEVLHSLFHLDLIKCQNLKDRVYSVGDFL